MEVLYPRCAGLDVQKDSVVACVRIASADEVVTEVQTFNTTTASLMSLSEWLASNGCTHVAMEATGVYWKPVWHILTERGWIARPMSPSEGLLCPGPIPPPAGSPIVPLRPRRALPLEDHILFRVMAGIRVVLKVVDGREDDLVIRSFAAIERNQFPFQNLKQLFNVAMFLTKNLDDVCHRAPLQRAQAPGCTTLR